MKTKSVCFSGHRQLPETDIGTIRDTLTNEITKLIDKGYTIFLTGGALGFDMLAESILLELREKYQIKLVLVLPCKNQTSKWKDSDIQIYNSILTRADKIIYTAENYYKGCMHLRNRYLVDNSNVCICYLSKNNGGTAYTVDYAKNKGIDIINIDTLINS